MRMKREGIRGKTEGEIEKNNRKWQSKSGKMSCKHIQKKRYKQRWHARNKIKLCVRFPFARSQAFSKDFIIQHVSNEWEEKNYSQMFFGRSRSSSLPSAFTTPFDSYTHTIYVSQAQPTFILAHKNEHFPRSLFPENFHWKRLSIKLMRKILPRNVRKHTTL